MEILNKKITDIKPYEKNPRKNDEAVKYVAESIKEFGFKVPIIIDKNGVIVCGHTRYKAAKKLKMEEVPCIQADDLNEEQIKAFRLADNKVSEYAEWDWELLKEEIEGLSTINVEDFGFEVEMPKTADEVVDDNFDVDEAVANIKAPKSKLGDVYKLGNHRLMVGDSTNEWDVERLMGGVQADLVMTDPPYNVNVSNAQGLTIENDNMDMGAFKEFLTKAFKNLRDNLKEGGAFYVWLAELTRYEFETALREHGLPVKQCLIWAKNAFTFGRQDYKWKHEPCLYGWKPGAGHYFAEIFNFPTVIEDEEFDIDKLTKDQLKALLSEFISEHVETTIQHENKPLKCDLHPTMKPIPLIAHLVENSSRVGEIVLDLFGGSGSTLIACEELNRVCYMMEYDPIYADVIIERWEALTGEKAIKIK
jgi:site-specific DNA-methyltransferase (adenine-specific)